MTLSNIITCTIRCAVNFVNQDSEKKKKIFFFQRLFCADKNLTYNVDRYFVCECVYEHEGILLAKSVYVVDDVAYVSG